MLDNFKYWVSGKAGYWIAKCIKTDAIGYSPLDYPVQSVSIKQSTLNALGTITAWEGHTVHIVDFEAINMDGQLFYRHYEFLNVYDFDKWQNDYIKFMCRE